MNKVLHYDVRTKNGFLSLEEIKLLATTNTIYDIHSLLISRGIHIGTGNIFYPNVILEKEKKASINIGDNNIFHANTSIIASKGKITIGSNNILGEGGCTIKTENKNDGIYIGNECRIMKNPFIYSQATLGNGSQILGPITVLHCQLEEGKSYQYRIPDMRGGVLKGAGLAKNLVLKQGEVIQSYTIFYIKDMKKQSYFHPNEHE